MFISEAKTVLRSIFEYNLDQLKAGASHDTYLVPFFNGDPGVGKTAIPKQVAAEVGVDYDQAIVAQYDAGEMAGLPFMKHDKIIVTDAHSGKETIEEHTKMIRLRPDYLPPIEREVGIFNLDEMPQAFLSNQNICSQLVNEWKVGHHRVSQGITMCATGNKPENKAGTTSIPTHLRDRLMFLSVDHNIDESLRYFAKIGVSPAIRSYLKNNPGALHEFNPAANASPTPRSWEKSSSILSLGLPAALRLEALSGQLGPRAVEMEAWLRVEDRMPKLHDVINDPDNAPVFGTKDVDVLYLLLASLADASTKGNIDKVLRYITRLPNPEFMAYFANDCFSRDKELLKLKAVGEWKMKHANKLIF